MFGFRFLKPHSTSYIMHFSHNRLVREGTGLSFFYFEPTSSIVRVPVKSSDVPFVFNEVTADFQPITVQGQLTYRVDKPKVLSQLLDFTVDEFENYVSDDPESLNERLIHSVQVLTRAVISKLTLGEALISAEVVVDEVLEKLRNHRTVASLGIVVLDLAVLSLKTSPEMARALESETRELLQQKADEAIYARRNGAVEQERRIKENELSTEIAIEEKRRTINETKMAAEIALELERQKLVDVRVENDRKEADSRAYALQAMVKPLEGADWKALMALSPGNFTPEHLIAMGFREMAENAEKIGEVNMSPDLLNSLLKGSSR